MITIVLLFGLLLRLVLLHVPSFTIDMNSFLAWSNHLVLVGPTQFYATIWSDYAPGYLYVLWFLGWIHQLLPQISHELLLKIPAVLADVATGWVIYKIARYTIYDIRYTKAAALAAAILYVFNPAIIFNSTVWGQVDAMSTLLVVIAVASLMNLEFRIWNLELKGKLVKVTPFFLLGLATVVKPQSIIFFPLFVIYVAMYEWKKSSKFKVQSSKFFLNVIAFWLPVFLLSAPFFPSDPLFGLVKHLSGSVATYPYTSVFAMNFWGIFGTWVSDVNQFLGVSYKLWGIIAFGMVYVSVVIGSILRSRTTEGSHTYIKGILRPPFGGAQNDVFLLALALVAGAFFLFPTRIHERYLHPFFALLLLGGFNLSQRLKKWLVLVYVGISGIHFLNLYYVYGYYSDSYLVYDGVISWIGNNFSVLSIAMVGMYVTLGVLFRAVYTND